MPALKNKIDHYLRTRGFASEPLRAIIMAQMFFLALALLVGAALLVRTSWGIFFFIGAALFSMNFWGMSSSLLKILPGNYSTGLIKGHFFRFLARLFLLCVILAAALLAGAPPLALALGIFGSLAVIGFTGAICLAD
ncbi:MAG: hypothetical protein FWG17_04940 [Desulfovibrionaceae bacterium]|nr:hypothetical protein [Desulfovibrionaceae bacterium]